MIIISICIYIPFSISLYTTYSYYHLVELLLPPSKRSTPGLFSICCYTYLLYLLSGLPIFTKVPLSLATPVKRTNYQVVCQVEGFPRPIINWRRVGMSLPAGKTEVNQGILTIKNLTPADSGLYECIATNSVGTKKARINVVVQQQKLGILCF